MLTVSDALRGAILNERLHISLLLDIEIDGVVENWSCNPYPITITTAGEAVEYKREKRLITISVPQGQADGTDVFQISLANAGGEFRSLINTGSSITAMIVCRDVDSKAVLEDPFTVFSGRCRSYEDDVDGEYGAVAVITYSGPLAWVGAYQSMRMTDDDQRRVLGLDNSFAYIDALRTKLWGGRVHGN